MEKQIESEESLEDCLEEFDKQLRKELLQKCELLSNQEFLDKYQGITEVAEELHLSSMIHYRNTGYFRYFRRTGVSNINDFLRKLNGEDWGAIKVYKEVLGTLGKKEYP